MKGSDLLHLFSHLMQIFLWKYKSINRKMIHGLSYIFIFTKLKPIAQRRNVSILVQLV